MSWRRLSLVAILACAFTIGHASDGLTVQTFDPINPVDNIQVALDPVFHPTQVMPFPSLSFGMPQAVSGVHQVSGAQVSGVETSGARPTQPTHMEKKKAELEKLLKIGVMLYSLDMYRDDVDNMVHRHEDVRENLKQRATDDVPAKPEHLVQVAHGNFLMGTKDLAGKDVCRTVYISGTNKYELVEAGAGAPFLFDGILEEKGLVGPEVVRRIMDDARDQALDFIRFNAFAVDPQFAAIESYNGGSILLNEGVMRGLDYAVDQARRHGLRVLLVLTDYFSDGAGGPLQYMQLAEQAPAIPSQNEIIVAKAGFYSNAQAQSVFKLYIQALVNRVNFYSGRKYAEDPTILGWDIINEPRCGDSSYTCVQDNRIVTFVSQIYAYLDSADVAVSQPITVGTDGFFSDPTYGGVFGQTATGVNPSNDPSTLLADFSTLCALVDFCEFNMYPDLYGQEDKGWVSAWVAAHSAVGIQLGKPVIVKEHGMQPTDKRMEFYKMMYDAELAQILQDEAKAGGLKGAAYWQAFSDGTRAIFWTLSDGGRWGIYPKDPEVKRIRQFSLALQKLSLQTGTCPNTVNTTSLLFKPPKCPKGYHGVNCEDVNECIMGLDECSVNAACTNTDGGYKCSCYKGWHGSGKLCVSMPLAQYQIQKSFFTKGTLSCINTSTPVVYPKMAPGWVEDPTGYFPVDSPANRIPVSLTDCKVACLTAVDCTSFYFDPLQGTCILKKNECPYTQSSVPGCDPATCGRTPTCDAPNESTCNLLVFQKNSPQAPTHDTWTCTKGTTYFLKQADLLTDGCKAPLIG